MNNLEVSVDDQINNILDALKYLESCRPGVPALQEIQTARVALIKAKHKVVIRRNQYANFNDLRLHAATVVAGGRHV